MQTTRHEQPHPEDPDAPGSHHHDNADGHTGGDPDRIASNRHPVVVVGASGTLGRLIALELNRRLNGSDTTPGDRQMLAAIVRNPAGLHGIEHLFTAVETVDITDQRALEGALGRLAGLSGRLGGIINAAGVVAFNTYEQTPGDTLETLFRTNTLPVGTILAAAARSVQDGGFVVNLTGIAATMPLLGMGAYCGSKAAASMLLQVGARELKRRNILVLDAQPGHTETGLSHRPISGTAPKLPDGLDPKQVAERIVTAVIKRETRLTAEDFTAAN